MFSIEITHIVPDSTKSPLSVQRPHLQSHSSCLSIKFPPFVREILTSFVLGGASFLAPSSCFTYANSLSRVYHVLTFYLILSFSWWKREMLDKRRQAQSGRCKETPEVGGDRSGQQGQRSRYQPARLFPVRYPGKHTLESFSESLSHSAILSMELQWPWEYRLQALSLWNMRSS